jgi:hypothetical protein
MKPASAGWNQPPKGGFVLLVGAVSSCQQFEDAR